MRTPPSLRILMKCQVPEMQESQNYHQDPSLMQYQRGGVDGVSHRRWEIWRSSAVTHGMQRQGDDSPEHSECKIALRAWYEHDFEPFLAKNVSSRGQIWSGNLRAPRTSLVRAPNMSWKIDSLPQCSRFRSSTLKIIEFFTFPVNL